MRVFVPMSDDWFSDPRFAAEKLVPYRCGLRLMPQLRVAREEVAREEAADATVWEMVQHEAA